MANAYKTYSKINCRTCLKKCIQEPDKNSIYNTQIYFMMSSCTSLLMVVGDNLPFYICKDCLLKLTIAFGFKNQAFVSDNLLRNHLTAAPVAVEFLSLAQNGTNSALTNPIKNEPIDIENNEVLTEFVAFKSESHEETDENITHNKSLSKKTVKCSDCSSAVQCSAIEENVFETRNDPLELQPPIVEKVEEMEVKVKQRIKYKASNSIKCPECPRTFTWNFSIISHMRLHSGDNPYSCDFCSKSFRWKSNLLTHRALHLVTIYHSCNLCSRKFVNPKQLKLHKNEHLKSNLYPCNRCKLRFANQTILSMHLRKCENKRKLFKCTTCKQVFNFESTLYYHKMMHRMNASKCNVCGAKEKSKTKLLMHMKVFHAEKISQCTFPFCNKQFSSLFEMGQHKSKHTLMIKNKKDKKS